MAASGGASSEMPECIICIEPHPPPESASIFGSDVCFGCVRKMFEDAVQHEDRYPPRWGSEVLPIRKFRAILPLDLYQRFTEKAKEYDTPPIERVYCKHIKTDTTDNQHGAVSCGEYVGQIHEAWRKDFAAGLIPRARCKSCSTPHCMICGDLLITPEHTCTTLPDWANDDDAFEGLLRGKDYQICPSTRCRRKIQLTDGCNHVICVCGQQFCFVCGVKAKESHFRRSRGEGGCPRYNHPSMPNAMWQPNVADVPRQHNIGLFQTFLLQEYRNQRVVAARRREQDYARRFMEREQNEHHQMLQQSDMQAQMERERETMEQHRLSQNILRMADIPYPHPVPARPYQPHNIYPTREPAEASMDQQTVNMIPPAYYLPQQHASMLNQSMTGVARLMPGPAMRPRMEHPVMQMAPHQESTAHELDAFEQTARFGQIAPPDPPTLAAIPPHLRARPIHAPTALPVPHGYVPMTDRMQMYQSSVGLPLPPNIGRGPQRLQPRTIPADIAPPGPRMAGPIPPHLRARTIPAPIATYGEHPATATVTRAPSPLRLPVAYPIIRSGLRPYPVLRFERDGPSQVSPGASTGGHDGDAEQRLSRTTMRVRDGLRRARVVLGGNERIQVQRSPDHQLSGDESYNDPNPVPVPTMPTLRRSQAVENPHSIFNQGPQAHTTGMTAPNAHSGHARVGRSRLVGSLPDSSIGDELMNMTLDAGPDYDDPPIWRPGM